MGMPPDKPIIPAVRAGAMPVMTRPLMIKPMGKMIPRVSTKSLPTPSTIAINLLGLSRVSFLTVESRISSAEA